MNNRMSILLLFFSCLCATFIIGYTHGVKEGKIKSSIKASGDARAIAAIKYIFDKETDGATTLGALEDGMKPE